jgi:hypothetical protein
MISRDTQRQHCCSMLTLVEGTGEMCECACVVVVVVVLQFTVSGLTVRRRYTSPQKDLRREATLKRPKGAQTERLFLLQLTQHACVPRRVSVCLSVCLPSHPFLVPAAHAHACPPTYAYDSNYDQDVTLTVHTDSSPLESCQKI